MMSAEKNFNSSSPKRQKNKKKARKTHDDIIIIIIIIENSTSKCPFFCHNPGATSSYPCCSCCSCSSQKHCLFSFSSPIPPPHTFFEINFLSKM
jgi:hypothetical protein